VYKAGFNETLGKLKGPGQMRAVWRPVGRSFEELILVFDPSNICSFEANSLSFDKIPGHLSGREFKDSGSIDDYAIRFVCCRTAALEDIPLTKQSSS
jgi:hypothetical protein